MWKKHKVVTLPTEKKAYFSLNSTKIMTNYVDSKDKPYQYKDKYNLSNINQHLYILSDDEIKEGIECKKIIATTDESLNIHWNKQDYKSLPQIPQSFIQHFVDEYNKGNVISDVMIEYEGIEWLDRPFFLKVNPDNTINIKTVKDSWSRDEVVKLLEEFNDRFGSLGLTGDFRKIDLPKFNKWIEENL